MFFVYFLKSKKNGVLYIGYTSDLRKRIAQHNNGESCYTKRHMPWQLVYVEGYRAKKDAYERERSLKRHAQGLRRLRERLPHSLS